jgi:hypothetical protein
MLMLLDVVDLKLKNLGKAEKKTRDKFSFLEKKSALGY